jgi:signal peptidase II
MNKRNFTIPLIVCFGICILDQLTKYYYLKNGTVYYNSGVMFGLYDTISPFIRIVSLGSFFGFILSFFLFLIYVLPKRSFFFKNYLGLFVGGIFGNVVDRVRLGKTIDFINVNIFSFNLADIAIWAGFILLSHAIFLKKETLWIKDNSRGQYLVNPTEQIRFAFKLAVIAFGSSLLLGLFSYAFFQPIFAENYINNGAKLLMLYTLSYFLITLTYMLLVFIGGLIISHRSAGPLYAFEKYVEDLIAGKDRKLNLRYGDNYQHLQKVADDLRKFLIKK